MNAIEKGRHAERLLNDEVLQEALSNARESLIHTSLEAETVEEREEARAKVHALGEVEHQLRRIMSDGIVEQKKVGT